MTFEELHEILDNKDRKLSKAELEQVIYEMKQDCANEMYKLLDEFPDKWSEQDFIANYQFYGGEQNAFQIVLDLLEHLEIKEDGEND